MKPNEIFEHINYSLRAFLLYIGSSVSVLQESFAKVLPGGPWKYVLIWPLYMTHISDTELNG